MMGKSTFSKRKFFKGVLVGSLLGMTSAISLAPRSGKETRDMVTKEISNDIDLVMHIKQQAQNISEQTALLKEMKETTIPEFSRETKKSLARFEFKSKPRMTAIQEQVTKIDNELKQAKKDIDI